MPVARGREGVRTEMHKFKHHQLHSGSPKGPVVTDRKQAIAIALHEAGLSRKNGQRGSTQRLRLRDVRKMTRSRHGAY
jgi:hypothetical protein